jgi:hypothetical protein
MRLAKIVDEFCNPSTSTKTFTIDYYLNTGMNGANEWFVPGHSTGWFETSSPLDIQGDVPTSNYILARNYNYPGDDLGDCHDFLVFDTSVKLIHFTNPDAFYLVYDLSIPPSGCITLTLYEGMTGSDSESQSIAEGLVYVPPPSHPVGGIYAPSDRFSILTPYIALVGLIGAISTIFAIRRWRKD